MLSNNAALQQRPPLHKPGLATEAETVESLIEKLRIMIPELLEANGSSMEYEVPFEILSRRFEFVQGEDI